MNIINTRLKPIFIAKVMLFFQKINNHYLISEIFVLLIDKDVFSNTHYYVIQLSLLLTCSVSYGYAVLTQLLPFELF